MVSIFRGLIQLAGALGLATHGRSVRAKLAIVARSGNIAGGWLDAKYHYLDSGHYDCKDARVGVH